MKQIWSFIKNCLIFATALSLGKSALAASPLDFKFNAEISEAQYKSLVSPIVNPMRYMFVMPAKSTGLIPGIDAGLALSFFKMPSEVKSLASQFLEKGDSLPSTLVVPRLTVQKGLLFGIDAGVNFSVIPTTKIKLWGIGLQSQVDLPIPLLPVYAAVRGGYSSLVGLDALSTRHINFEALFSAGLPPGISLLVNLEPWVGFGMDLAKSTSSFSLSVAGTQKDISHTANWTEKYVMAGLRLSLTMFKISAETHQSIDGMAPLYTVKVGVGL